MVIDALVIYGEHEFGLLGCQALSAADGGQALAGSLHLIVPCILYRGDARKALQHIGADIVSIDLACIRGNEGIDTHHPLRLTAVADEPAQMVQLIDGQQVVVGGRVEGESHILG